MKKIMKLRSLVILLSCCFLMTGINVFSQNEKPSPRYSHTLVTIVVGNDTLLYLFGGANSSKAVINELWAYNKDNSKWEKKESNNPPSRRGHAAVVHNNKMIVFFGEGETGLLNDTWEYDPPNNTWEELPYSGTYIPEARKNHTASVVNNKVVVVGGKWISGGRGVVEEFDPSTNTWVQKASYPGAVMGHGAFTNNNNVYVFGGSDPPSFRNDMWSYNLSSNSWNYVNAGGSTPDESAYFGYASSGQYFYTVGGNNDAKTVFDKSYMFNLVDLTWTELGDVPALTKLAAAFVGDNSGNGELYTFGGQDDQGVESDIFLCYNTINGTWIPVHIPQLEDNKYMIDVYPNPFNNEITISGTDNNQTIYVEIYDILGKMVFTQKYKTNKININLNGFDRGTYILKVKDENGIIIKIEKIVKQ
ncbi:MAG: T9SS type A sorting domain-containing protein [Bacteroidales bacterium]|nr:T9SS type A sorting domain-containing protein [Bacteroidales bacterium]